MGWRSMHFVKSLAKAALARVRGGCESRIRDRMSLSARVLPEQVTLRQTHHRAAVPSFEAPFGAIPIELMPPGYAPGAQAVAAIARQPNGLPGEGVDER